MLKQIADGVLVHESEFVQSNAVVVQGADGVLLVDAGLLDSELTCLANDLGELGRSVVAGFSTHPDWDHLIWHAELGAAPRYGTARCAAAVAEQLADPDIKTKIIDHLESTGIADQISLDLYGLIGGLPADAAQVPWDGPEARIIEHKAHAPGHAALLIGTRRVLVAGDMLSDVLVPMLDLESADPIGDYLTALDLFEEVADDVDVVVPGHGSVGVGEVRERIALDRAYVLALRAGDLPEDPRVSSPKPGWEWVSDVHDGQFERLKDKR